MFISRLEVSNFKSFDSIEVELGRFHVLVGANASGKSNFVDSLKFLRDIGQGGLGNAMSMQGGAEYLRNIAIGTSRELSIRLTIECDPIREFVLLATAAGESESLLAFMPRRVDYGFGLEFYSRRRGHKRVTFEEFLADCDIMEFKKGGDKIGEATLALSRDAAGVRPSIQTEGVDLSLEDLMPPMSWSWGESGLGRKDLFVENPGGFPGASNLVTTLLRNIAIYDFDPRLPKRAVSVTGKTDLEPDGSNLAIVLRDLLDDKKSRQAIYRLIRDVLPFVEDMKVEKLADKSLFATLREVYSQKAFLPAFLVSDGTINLTALIVALYFDDKPIVVIEEPERNIHPHLISKVMEMMRDASENLGKQIMVTTHNPEVVRHAGLDNLLLVRRDDQGFSTIRRASQSDEVRHFLEHDMGIEELFVENLLR